MNAVQISVVAVVIVAAVVFVLGRRGRDRQRAMRQLLDAADALEARLRTARQEIEAIAGDDASDSIRDALKEMLRQRLWLREHGRTATLAELELVRTSIEEARVRIDQQLRQIERARGVV